MEGRTKVASPTTGSGSRTRYLRESNPFRLRPETVSFSFFQKVGAGVGPARKGIREKSRAARAFSLVLAGRIELPANCLKGNCSSTELHEHLGCDPRILPLSPSRILWEIVKGMRTLLKRIKKRGSRTRKIKGTSRFSHFPLRERLYNSAASRGCQKECIRSVVPRT